MATTPLCVTADGICVQLRSQAARAALLDVYTDELKSTLKEIAQLSQHHHCHHHHHQQQQQQLLTSTASAPDT